MTNRDVARRLRIGAVSIGVGLAMATSVLGPPAQAKPSSPAAPVGTTSAATTSKREAARMAAVPTPKLGWKTCYQTAKCAEVKVPLDYDRPGGKKITLALAKIPARDQKHKIGSLFVNPGGPGGSGVGFALEATNVFGPDVLDRFDVVGMDPRGIGFSTQVSCFTSPFTQEEKLGALLTTPFPVGTAQTTAFQKGAAAEGKACSSTGKPLSASMSTAEVARDMELMRRAVGDKQLSYFGVSYGTYLGQVYANLYPDKVRSMVIDGVLDPVAWAGTPATAGVPFSARLKSNEGAWKALKEILVRCDRVGGQKCSFAGGDPVANFDLIAQRLKKKPLIDGDPETGQEYRFGYPELVSAMLGSLYSPYGYEDIVANLTDLLIVTEPPATRSAQGRNATAIAQKKLTVLKRVTAQLDRQSKEAAGPRAPGYAFPYDNSIDAFSGVACTDGLNPKSPAAWPAAAAAADKVGKYFGSSWTWASAQCATKTWTAKDEDAYRGPFTAKTAHPVLVVGNYWDPATNYAGAQKAASLLPNSRLLSSDSWGHTAYQTSECVTSAVDRYLVGLKLPAQGTVCVGDVQPFADQPAEDARTARVTAKHVPVAALRP